MSKVLHIRDSHIYGLCAAAGLEPNSVKDIHITPEVIIFEVCMEPEQRGDGGPLTVIVTYPWS